MVLLLVESVSLFVAAVFEFSSLMNPSVFLLLLLDNNRLFGTCIFWRDGPGVTNAKESTKESRSPTTARIAHDKRKAVKGLW